MSSRFSVAFVFISFCFTSSLTNHGRLFQISTNKEISAYKYGKECYIEDASETKTKDQINNGSNLTETEGETVWFVSPKRLSINALLMLGGEHLVTFCGRKDTRLVWKGNPVPALQQLLGQYNQSTVRQKRSIIYRKTRTARRGQAQSQYVGFKGSQGNNRAIATSDKTGARTQVGGGHGIGQAQSQYVSDCGSTQGCSGGVGVAPQESLSSGANSFGSVIPQVGIGYTGSSYPGGQILPQIGGVPGWPSVDNISQSIYPNQVNGGYGTGFNGQKMVPQSQLGTPNQGFSVLQHVSQGSQGTALPSMGTFPQLGQGSQIAGPAQFAPSSQTGVGSGTANYQVPQGVYPYLTGPPVGQTYNTGEPVQFAGGSGLMPNVQPGPGGMPSSNIPSLTGETNIQPGSGGVLTDVQPRAQGGLNNFQPGAGGGMTNIQPEARGGLTNVRPGAGRGLTKIQSGTGNVPSNGIYYPGSGHPGMSSAYPTGNGITAGSVGSGHIQSQGGGFYRGVPPGSSSQYQPTGSSFPSGHPYPSEVQNVGMPSRTSTDRTGAASGGTFGYGATNGGSQSETQLTVGHEKIAASSAGQSHFAGGSSQSQVQGSYSGNGTISAQAQGGNGGIVSQSQILGTNNGAMGSSSSQAGSMGQSQTQVQMAYPSGISAAEAQSLYGRGLTSSNVQASGEGGQASSQASGQASTSSQAQVGVRENEGGRKFDPGHSTFMGTGMASSQSGSFGGHSQSQLIGQYEEGNHYASSAQAGSGRFIGSHGGVRNVAKPLSPGMNPTQGHVQGSPHQPLHPNQFTGGHGLTQYAPNMHQQPTGAVSPVSTPKVQGIPGVTKTPHIPKVLYSPGRPRGQSERPPPINGWPGPTHSDNLSPRPSGVWPAGPPGSNPPSLPSPRLEKPLAMPSSNGYTERGMHYLDSQNQAPHLTRIIHEEKGASGQPHRPGYINGPTGPIHPDNLRPRPSGVWPPGQPGSNPPGLTSPRLGKPLSMPSSNGHTGRGTQYSDSQSQAPNLPKIIYEEKGAPGQPHRPGYINGPTGPTHPDNLRPRPSGVWPPGQSGSNPPGFPSSRHPNIPKVFHSPGRTTGKSDGRPPLIEWPGPTRSSDLSPRPSHVWPPGPPSSNVPGFPSPKKPESQPATYSSSRSSAPNLSPGQGQPLPIGQVIRPRYPGSDIPKRDSTSTVTGAFQPGYGPQSETGERKDIIGSDASDVTGSVYASAPGGQSQAQGIFIGGDKIRDGTKLKVLKSSQPNVQSAIDLLPSGQYPFISGVTGLETQKRAQNDNQSVTFNGPVLNPGDSIPGFPGQTIPNGFRGHVYPSGQQPFKTTSQHAVNGFKTHIVTQPGSSENPILTKVDGTRSGVGATRRNLHVSVAHPGDTLYYPQGPGKAQSTTNLSPGIQNGMRQGASNSQDTAIGRGNTASSNGLLGNGSPTRHHGMRNGEDGNGGTTLLNGSKGMTRKNGRGPHVSHTYYSKESPCGYFSFSCNIVFKSKNKVKICKPLPIDVVCCC